MAHASSVNCLKIGRKSSRVLVTGGEDHKVNLWAIGKPNAILVRTPDPSLLASELVLLSFFFFSSWIQNIKIPCHLCAALS